MKVTSVELHPAGSTAVAVLSYRDPGRQNPYNVKNVSGLDADEIIPRYYGGSGTTSFYNLSLEKRDLVFTISLNPQFATQSYSDLRDELYKMISSSRTGVVQVQFKNGATVVAVVSGFVTKFETDLFAKEPSVTMTVNCKNPMLQAPNTTVIAVGALNPDLTVITDAVSTAPHGFTFGLTFVQAKASMKIRNPDDATWSFEVTPVGGFLAGDVLQFSSEYNNKKLYITRGAATIHVADVITPGSVWPILFPGENKFKVDGVASPGGIRNMNWAAISHYLTYWGV